MAFVQQREESLEEKRLHCTSTSLPAPVNLPPTIPLPADASPPDVKVVKAFESALALLGAA